MTEKWVPITGHEGRYEVSNKGRVRSLKRPYVPRMKILSTTPVAGWYPAVSLCAQGKCVTVFVHRLVMEHFGPPQPEWATMVLHRDDVKTNNAIENLQWGTSADNAADATRNGRNANARKMECKRKHPYTPENTIRGSHGERKCRTCRDMVNRARSAA